MNITEATKDGTGDAESNQVDRDEDYNTRYASYRGYTMAFERTKPIPRRAADFSLTSLTAAAGATTPEAVVDHLAARFLSVPLAAKDRDGVHRSTPAASRRHRAGAARAALSGAQRARVSSQLRGAR